MTKYIFLSIGLTDFFGLREASKLVNADRNERDKKYKNDCAIQNGSNMLFSKLYVNYIHFTVILFSFFLFFYCLGCLR